jgi:ADP-ribose pyrophosphatase
MKNKQIKFSGRFMTVYTFDKHMPDGTYDDFEVCEYRPSVKFFVFNERKEILLVREYRHEVNKDVLRIPGGFIDDGETPQEAIVRECQEELGVKPNKILQYAIRYQGYDEERKPSEYAYLCSELMDSPLPSADRHEYVHEVIPMDLDDVANQILEGKMNNDWRGLIFLRMKRDIEQGKIQL